MSVTPPYLERATGQNNDPAEAALATARVELMESRDRHPHVPVLIQGATLWYGIFGLNVLVDNFVENVLADVEERCQEADTEITYRHTRTDDGWLEVTFVETTEDTR